MVIPPPVRPPRITKFLKPYVLRMHFTNKYMSAQVIHTPTATVASSASSQEKALRPSLETTRDVAAASKIGKILAERLLLKEIPAVSVHLKREQKYHEARQQILYKLRRFEKLAELDPVELEKRMLDQEEDEDMQVFEAVFLSSVQDKQQIPQEFKKLISDLMVEEEIEFNSLEEDRDMVVSRICKRLELWKEVESNTIDMMIEEDFSREDVGWKKNVEQISKMAGELELAIFGFLVEEFSKELVC